MEKITYKEQLLAVFNAQVLPESNLIRDDKNLFTFSPIQDELTNFKLETKGVFYKEQTCFRQVYPANLINPLATPCQPLISLFSFQKIDFTEIINTFISAFLSKFIQKNDIYVIIPDIPVIRQPFSKITDNIIPIEKKRLYCNIPLDGEHYYIKICVKYYDGLVTLMNFVLVNYLQGKFSQLDSVFFPLRLDMIKEKMKSIYESRNYHNCYQKIYEIVQNHELTHFYVSQFEALSTLINKIGKSSSHKHGYVLKKLAREIFLESDCNDVPLNTLLETYPQMKDELTKLYSDYSANIDRAIHRIQKSKVELSAKYAYETLGLPYKLYQSKIDNNYKIPELPSNFAYYRYASKNIYQNPIESYK